MFLLYDLPLEMINLLRNIDFSEIEGDIVLEDNLLKIDEEKFDLFIVILLENIGLHGYVEDQSTVNSYGRKIEDIIDAIYAQ